MSNQDGDKTVGGFILIGILFCFANFILATVAYYEEDYSGTGMFMLAASLPISAAIHGVLNNAEK